MPGKSSNYNDHSELLNELFLLSQRYLETKNYSYKRSFWQNNLTIPRLSILIGQRGIGKTTLIAQYLLSQTKNNAYTDKNILYVPSDHFSLGNASLYEIAEQFVQLGGAIIAFDEIHKYSAWSKELKSIYDTFPKLQIIASGSSALEIYQGTHDLTRRAIVYKVKGFSLREYLELNLNISLPSYSLDELLINHESIAKQIITEHLTPLKQKILALFSDYLQVGYYPYSFELKDKALFFTTLDQNFHTIIESDLAAIYPALTGGSIRKIKQLLAFIAKTVPFTPRWQNIKNLVEIGDMRTLKTYFKYLEDAGLIRMVMKYSQKMHQLESPEKVYLENTNQLYAISNTAQNIGTVRETFFLNMLSFAHEVCIPTTGDFIVDGDKTFEIGGKNKSLTQIKNEQNGYVVCDGIEQGIGKKIPLWLFGFL